ncbi:MAG TPA: anaerobic ribonucleoside-triphosphate reductase activating protein [Nevskiaceae bacterium]|nr:anaerobic ribonucleoside-triphosphate reductase activating protein [Nevskiaceae bacterium]
MKIGGLQKVSLIDFPGRIAAIVFTKGCNFTCPYCHNRDLVLGTLPTISQRTVLSFLKKRKKVLDGVVMTGGEPLLQPDLADFMAKVKKLGYKIKLDTNGSFPKPLARLLKKNLLDYVALDFKAPLDGYHRKAIGIEGFDPAIWVLSLKLLLKSKIPFEVRTTIVPGIHDKEKLVEMAKQLKKLVGQKKISWFWQNFQPKNCLDPKFEEKKPFGREQLEEFLKVAKRSFPAVELRNY